MRAPHKQGLHASCRCKLHAGVRNNWPSLWSLAQPHFFSWRAPVPITRLLPLLGLLHQDLPASSATQLQCYGWVSREICGRFNSFQPRIPSNAAGCTAVLQITHLICLIQWLSRLIRSILTSVAGCSRGVLDTVVHGSTLRKNLPRVEHSNDDLDP
jgi:hypothetical protein